MDEEAKKVKEETEAESEDVVESETESETESESESGSETEIEGEVAETETEQPPEKMLTQSQVNELVGRARQEGRESAMRDLYGRYGVSGDEELDEVFGNGQKYYDLDDEYKLQGDSMRALKEENALLKTGVRPERWDDIRFIIRGKGLEITPEVIEREIPSHPEWRSEARVEAPTAGAETKPTAVLKRLGSEAKPEEGNSEADEEARLKNLFGM